MSWSRRLILLVVGLVIFTGLVSGSLALHNTNLQFNHYLGQSREDQALRLAEVLSIYYEETGSFQGVDQVLGTMRSGGMGRGHMMMRGGMGPNTLFILTDAQGRILWHPEMREKGKLITLERPDRKYPVVVGRGSTVGYLLPWEKPFAGALNLEMQFSKSVLKAIVWGTFLSILVAVVLGLLVSKSLLVPLRQLSRAAQEFSRGNLAHRLDIKGNPDFAAVSHAFNQMALNLAQQEKLKKELVADVAHELRTPLTILSGHLESLQEGVQEATPEVITSLHDEVLRLQGLVDDLQQLSLAEAKQLPLEKKAVDLAYFLCETLALFEAEAKEKGVTLVWEQLGSLPLVFLDKRRMRQVLLNLLSNALRYVPMGGKIQLRGEQRGQKIFITVQDNGPGISPVDLPFVFDRFYRGDKSRNRMSGGTGLGLAISKGFVEAHGGELSVSSELGQGTIFVIKLPVA